MDEFSLIDVFFKEPAKLRNDVVFGIGDDAACVSIPEGYQLLISTDTLVAEVHFLSSWDPYDIAYKSVMVNVSDIAAMGALPCWVSLALTLPSCDESWLGRFSKGLHDSLNQFNIALIGGDTTRGPLSITLTIHGLAAKGRAIRRSGAKAGDKIYVSGELGAAALAVTFLENKDLPQEDQKILFDKLKHPKPRVDLQPILQQFATAAIDISDGLSADLNHICYNSKVGACLVKQHIPVHPLVVKYERQGATAFALRGGDDYELCFTIPEKLEPAFLHAIQKKGIQCFPIGVIEKQPGLRIEQEDGCITSLSTQGYQHFS
ncbi:thiamine-phosphate kinase [Legionella jordanis]|uniref:thiamine-phosphate kinase n=1 Tax=Legionella jordanis TaxID=456 RepID=UPI000F0053D8|nr:thiamine-phosphate kinase [Legionella jordanis]RMX22033.1 thiamine-phosphate kinase [Legionella jordanis]